VSPLGLASRVTLGLVPRGHTGGSHVIMDLRHKAKDDSRGGSVTLGRGVRPVSPLDAGCPSRVTLGLVPRVSLIARFSAFVAKNIQQVVHCGS
jgi:hypothetical protein